MNPVQARGAVRSVAKTSDVTHLTLVDPSGPSPLEGIERFTALDSVELQSGEATDLAPLTDITLESLSLVGATAVDLTTLARIPGLRYLSLRDLVATDVPTVLPLPAGLNRVSISAVGGRSSAAIVGALAAAIDWESLASLVDLQIFTAETADGPARVDLAFLQKLPALERLDLSRGVEHDGPQASPLEAPLDRLPRSLQSLRAPGRRPSQWRALLAER